MVLGTETPQGELFFTNAAEQFDAGDGGSCAIKVLEAEHRPCSGFNTPVILFDHTLPTLGAGLNGFAQVQHAIGSSRLIEMALHLRF